MHRLERSITHEDALLVYPLSSFAAAYYAGWSYQPEPWPPYAHGFAVRFERPRSLVLPANEGFSTNPAVLDDDLAAFLDQPHRRLVFFTATEARESVHAHIRRVLARSGYRFDESAENRPPYLLWYTRAPPGD